MRLSPTGPWRPFLLLLLQHGITPQAIKKARMMGNLVELSQQQEKRAYVEPDPVATSVAEEVTAPLTLEERRKRIDILRRQMQEAAKKMEFIEAARLRDEMLALMAEIPSS